jgi:hypothetical protein
MWQTTKDVIPIFILDYPDVIIPEPNVNKEETSYIMGLMKEFTEQWRKEGGSTIINDKRF